MRRGRLGNWRDFHRKSGKLKGIKIDGACRQESGKIKREGGKGGVKGGWGLIEQ